MDPIVPEEHFRIWTIECSYRRLNEVSIGTVCRTKEVQEGIWIGKLLLEEQLDDRAIGHVSERNHRDASDPISTSHDQINVTELTARRGKERFTKIQYRLCKS